MYELGINVYEDIDFDFEDNNDDPNPIGRNIGNGKEKSRNEFALMTAPPRHVLKALDEKSRLDSSGHYVVGFDSSSGAGFQIHNFNNLNKLSKAFSSVSKIFIDHSMHMLLYK